MSSITFDDLNTWTLAQSKNLVDNLGVVPEDDNAVKADDILYYLEETTPAVNAFLMNHGLWIDEASKILHYDTSQFADIRVLTDKIAEEYDDEDLSGDELPTWQEYGLSGDDDVDYNSGYIGIIMGVLEELEKTTKG